MRKRGLRAAVALALLAVLALGSTSPAAAQCAMCRTALTSSPEGKSISEQFNLAILVMVFAPYLVAGTLAGVLFRRQIGAHLGRVSQKWPAAAWVQARWRRLRVVFGRAA